ncbi:4-coumarate- ligase [Apiospora rasikravindrae]|uniref:4-coumarate- ligase n=1 Tax=Apiospora rasikravindrae TaxID=990691 RepID=A0ABR1S1P2_9PEZI
MIFHPPSWVPKLPFGTNTHIRSPSTTLIGEFWSEERYGRQSIASSRDPFVCGVTGNAFTTSEMRERYELLARSLSKRMGWRVNEDTPWDKVVCVYSLNSIDYIMSTFAIHRLNGIATPANAAYSPSELEFQLRSSGAKAVITCVPLLDTALKAAKAVGIAPDRIFIMQTGGSSGGGKLSYKTLDELIDEGRSLPPLESPAWTTGQGARQVAYISYSSGTSGLPKGVMISHRNVIANIMQLRWFESVGRSQKGVVTQVVLGVLPLSHIYGLIVVALSGIYRGDQIVIMPRFELKNLLECIQRFKINQLCLVPPIIIQLLKNQPLCRKYDLSSVRYVYTGAAPLGTETHEEVVKSFPGWEVGQGYGMTETATVVLSSGENDILVGAAGSLVSGCVAKIIDTDTGRPIDVTDQKDGEEEKRGELWLQSPSISLGYLNNERATAEAFVWDEDGRWIRTGDVAVVRRSKAGHEHFAIVDRIKELIKVKVRPIIPPGQCSLYQGQTKGNKSTNKIYQNQGHQVAPAELEAHLLTHPFVNDCTVIPVPDERAGEVPKAFVVKSPAAEGRSNEEIAQAICKHVEDHKAHYKWLKGGVAFLDAVPKSPSGKILRRLLRDKEREERRINGSKL